MSAKSLPDQPSLEQYKKQAKDLLKSYNQSELNALERVAVQRPRSGPFRLADAQFVIAREHGFENWPEFAKRIEALRLTCEVAALADPVAAFIEAACVPLDDNHRSGTLERAELILARYPQVAGSDIYTAAILANESRIRASLGADPALATAKGGPRHWDPLTYLCFSRYLRLDRSRADAFVSAARVLLEAGASANTGFTVMIDHPKPRPILEAAIYGAAGLGQHAGLTLLLLEHGADPNDEETPYHVPETRDNAVLEVLLASGKLNPRSLITLLLRKCDWHDEEGLRRVLEHGADPNEITIWGVGALHQAVRRDNSLEIIKRLLDYGADPSLTDRHGRSAITLAAYRGRAGALALFEQRGTPLGLTGVEALLAACARNDREAVDSLLAADPQLKSELGVHAGTVLAQFSGVGNVAGVSNLLDLGVSVDALYREGDGYFGIARDSTALHAAAWRAWPEVVSLLIARGADVNVADGQGRTALQLAVKACVDSYWTARRSPESVRALLDAGASAEGIALPTGYDQIDELLRGRIVN